MNNFLNKLNLIIQAIFNPFILLFKTNAKPDPNKKVYAIVVLLISLIIVVALIFLYYKEVIFKWY